jgi:hypothetical protein
VIGGQLQQAFSLKNETLIQRKRHGPIQRSQERPSFDDTRPIRAELNTRCRRIAQSVERAAANPFQNSWNFPPISNKSPADCLSSKRFGLPERLANLILVGLGPVSGIRME